MTLKEEIELTEKAYNATRQRLFVARQAGLKRKIKEEKELQKQLLSKLNQLKSQLKNT